VHSWPRFAIRFEKAIARCSSVAYSPLHNPKKNEIVDGPLHGGYDRAVPPPLGRRLPPGECPEATVRLTARPLGAAARRTKPISSASQRPSLQGDREMAITLSTTGNGFVPTSDVGNKKGLHWKKDSQSSATLNGSGLVNSLSVTVLYPQQSQNPRIKW